MPRAMWSGSISFGLVNVPVKLFTAARSKDIGFNQLHAADGARIQMKRVCSVDGHEVPYDEIAKGYEVSPDRYVMISQAELDALAPEVTRGIDIESFIDLEEIDPVYFENSYYLVPDKGGAKAYGLLLAAMRESGKIALGRVVLRSKQYLVALRPTGNALAMSTLYYPDEVVDQDDLGGLPEQTTFADRELAMAQQLIAALSEDFEPEKYHDEYRERVLDLIEQKASGQPIQIEAKPEKAAPVVDLMAALEASIAATGKNVAAAKEAPAKRSAKKGDEAKVTPAPSRKRSEAATATAPSRKRSNAKDDGDSVVIPLPTRRPRAKSGS